MTLCSPQSLGQCLWIKFPSHEENWEDWCSCSTPVHCHPTLQTVHIWLWGLPATRGVLSRGEFSALLFAIPVSLPAVGSVSYGRAQRSESCTTLSCLRWFLCLQGAVCFCTIPKSTGMPKAWGNYLHVHTSPGDGEETFLIAPGSTAGLLSAWLMAELGQRHQQQNELQI